MQFVSWTDLPACVALLLKFLCQIPNDESVAGSAWLAGLSLPACLMKRMPVGFIIKELLITDGERGVMERWGLVKWLNVENVGQGGKLLRQFFCSVPKYAFKYCSSYALLLLGSYV